MAASVYVGLAVTQSVDATLATATFTNVQLGSAPVPGPTGLPAPWTNRDIGSPRPRARRRPRAARSR